MPDEELSRYAKELKNKERRREGQNQYTEPTNGEPITKEKKDAVEESDKKSSRYIYISVNKQLTVMLLFFGVVGIYGFLTKPDFFSYFALIGLLAMIIGWKQVKIRLQSQAFSKPFFYFILILLIHWSYKLLNLLYKRYLAQ